MWRVMKSAERPLGRAVSDFLIPRTRASRLMRTQRRTLVSSPCSSGMRQWLSTSTTVAGEAVQYLASAGESGGGFDVHLRSSGTSESTRG